MPTEKDNAICIRKMDWSESSQIIVLMTERLGKISAVAKGAKRQSPSSLAKFSGGVELLSAGEAVLIIKPGRDLAQLIEWDLHDAFWPLRQDLQAYQLAMYAADLMHHVVQDHDAHPASFQGLAAFLKSLAFNEQYTNSTPQALLQFQWTMIRDMGLTPVLERDAETGQPLDSRVRTYAFSAAAGGVVADTGCGDRWRVRQSTIHLLQNLSDNQSLAEHSAQSIERANRLLCTYFRTILDKQLPTMTAILD